MYSTQASNWFNQSVLGAKDGSARPQRTTHDDHHRGAGEDEMVITKRHEGQDDQHGDDDHVKGGDHDELISEHTINVHDHDNN